MTVERARETSWQRQEGGRRVRDRGVAVMRRQKRITFWRLTSPPAKEDS
jgi:hypothetical protein